ncbi:MAG: C13 family peptidase [Solirubrobacterales bacterium]
MSRRAKLIITACLLIAVSGLMAIHQSLSDRPAGSVKIGILLPLTGPESVDSKEVLDWMANRLNKTGGIDGKPVELVYKDTARAATMALARELVSDPSIQIVVGPGTSGELHSIAPLFIKQKKLLISPMATAGDVFRAYGKKDYIWRTCQSDIAQVRAILDELSKRKVTRVALICPQDSYGKTFADWTGFFCTELGIELVNAVSYSDSSELNRILDQALTGDPEYVISASYAEDSARLVKLMKTKKTASRLFFTDASETNYLIEALGPASEGIELMSPAADPDSGFEAAYSAKFGYYPYDYAAPTCDAFLLAVYTQARQASQTGLASLIHHEALEASFKKVINGTGPKVPWNEPGRAIASILSGNLPDVQGASGPLRFDREFGVDPVESFYSLNRVERRDGGIDFYTIRRFSSSESQGVGLLDEGASAASTRASDKFMRLDQTGQPFLPAAERKNLRAVIVATSHSWDNYRHQADALTIYQLLRKNGVSDQDIILFSVDDVPWMPENSPRGNLRHEMGGANLRKNAVIDYSGAAVTPDNLRKVLLGQRSPQTPVVLESDANTNVLFYLVGHGMPRAINFANGQQLTDKSLARLFDEMYRAKKYRQVLMLVEACNGASLAMQLTTPGVLFLSGSSSIESSFGANYDPEIRQWLSDEFTAQSIKAMAEPGLKLEDLYLSSYTHVTGSHVTLINYDQFGDLQTRVGEFTQP